MNASNGEFAAAPHPVTDEPVPVYNSTTVKARNILAMTDPNDIFEKHYFCTARVHIDRARFVFRYDAKEEREVPWLLLAGFINDSEDTANIFIEDYVNDVFPCGSKKLRLMQRQDVTIMWKLTDSEKGLLASRGLFRKGFLPPNNIEGNDMEFPVSAIYRCIRNSAIGFIEIYGPYRIETETRLNGYHGLFELTQTHPDTIAELEGQLSTGLQIPPGFESQYNIELDEENTYYNERTTQASVPTNDYEPLYDDASAEVNVPISAAEKAENDIVDRVNAKISGRASEDEIVHANNKNDDAIRDLIDSVHSEVAAEKAKADDTQNLYDNDNFVGERSSAGSISKLSDRMAHLKRKAQEDADEQHNIARRNDIAADNKSLNEGIDDIAGQGAGNSSDGKPMTKSEQQKAKSEKESKKQRDIARRNDIAADNKALNEGIDDIAGQGAGNSSNNKTGGSLAQSLLAGLSTGSSKPDAPDSSSRFL